MATLHVIAGSHEEGQLCVGCACLPTFSSHTSGSFERALPLERPNNCYPHPPPLFTEVCVEISVPLLHRFYTHSPPTHIRTSTDTILPASNLMPPSFKDITLCICLGLSRLSWLFFVAFVFQFTIVSSL